MSLINKLVAFLRSPQGKKTTQKAMSYARSPEGKRKIAETRQRVTAKKGTGRLK